MRRLSKKSVTAGARIKLINDGDVAGAINTAFDDTGVDILFGIGGAPEGVIAAVGLNVLAVKSKEDSSLQMKQRT